MQHATGALVIEAIAAVAALIVGLVGWAMVERSGRQRATRDAATAAARAALQGKRVVVEADRRAAAEAAAAVHRADVDDAAAVHVEAMAEVEAEAEAIAAADSAEATAAALRKAFQ